MRIHPRLLEAYPDLNPQQREVVGHIDGPLLVIAGPGSGKTYSLILRAMNLLLLEEASPEEIVLCTFTEKAAFEMRDRLSEAARKAGYQEDMSQILVGTIHSISNRFLTRYRHHTKLGHGYETLDDLTQRLFLHDHFEAIFWEPDDAGKYLHAWKTHWTAIQGAMEYFNKITEEMIAPERLIQSGDAFLRELGKAYQAYTDCLFESNRVDFPHQQRLFLDLLENPDVGPIILEHIKFVLVDEYQDTNYIQEQLVFKLTEKTRNLCVVGDEDQSLYRFRGATVRNILEFPERMPSCKQVKLTTNYRSHAQIIEAYDRWMATADWSGEAGQSFRFDKSIQPDPEVDFPDYPAVFSIYGTDKRDESRRFAEFVAYLKRERIIEDFSQVALLLHSVRHNHSGPFVEALEKKGIPAFCPRARAYFDEEEIQLMVAALAVILGYHGDARGDLHGFALKSMAQYVEDAILLLAREHPHPSPLSGLIQKHAAEVDGLKRGETLDRRLADYFYEVLAVEPFTSFLKDENRARRLAIFSTLLNVFQNYYHYTVLTYNNRIPLRLTFFNSFLRLLHSGGINDYEDPDQPLPKGYVQVMTIHQAKGLEFPVVVASVEKTLKVGKKVDRDLSPYYHREPFEPEKRITAFDRLRLHYVAFSRPQKVLVLTSTEPPKDYFAPIWQGLPQWPYVEKDLLAAQHFYYRPRMAAKKTYSFTGDLRVYETCPRQYQFYRHYDFTPSRSAVIFFGLLVHQTIEDIHRIVLDGGLHTINDDRVVEIFDRTYDVLTLTEKRPPGPEAKAAGLRQVMNYVHQNRDEMARIIDAEVDVSLEKDGYILAGKVDLMLGGDGKLELLDFKTQEKPDDPILFDLYERQLCTYGHILENRYDKRPERLLLYWTAEENKGDAITVFPYRPAKVEKAMRHFDHVVKKIEDATFAVRELPNSKICQECDFRHLCRREGILPEGR